MVVLEIGIFYEELSFGHYLQHYSGISRTTEIQLCQWVHHQVNCDKISPIDMKSYKFNRQMRCDQLATASSSTLP